MNTNVRAIDLDLPKPIRPSLVATVSAYVKTIARAVINRRAVTRLAELDDTQLADIGLSRADVEQVLRKSGLTDDPSRMLAVTARDRSRRSLRRT